MQVMKHFIFGLHNHRRNPRLITLRSSLHHVMERGTKQNQPWVPTILMHNMNLTITMVKYHALLDLKTLAIRVCMLVAIYNIFIYFITSILKPTDFFNI